MKIYKLSWFDEDDYGPMRGLYVIIQEENEEDAIETAKGHVKDMYNMTIKELEREYEKYEIRDVTHYSVIASGQIGI